MFLNDSVVNEKAHEWNTNFVHSRKQLWSQVGEALGFTGYCLIVDVSYSM